MDDFVDTVVIGAGVVGLAVARAAALAGHEVTILEAAESFGTGTSSRNSEVIHAGLYYTPGSLKATACVRGKALLYEYCQRRGVGHRRCGKLVVATSETEASELANIKSNAEANGVHDLELLDAAEARRRSPAVRCVAALWSPSSGIIDSHGLMAALLADATNAGATLVTHTRATGGDVRGQRPVVEADGVRLHCRRLINAAGLGAQAVAGGLRGLDPGTIPTRYLCKGTYFTVRPAPKFDCLVYPVPSTASLGIHVTIDLAGQLRLGPDQEWVDGIDYRVHPDRAEACAKDVARYLDLAPDAEWDATYAGIRPKVQAPGAPGRDFVLHGPETHGVAGLVNLYGMESPALTACLALGETILGRVA